MEIDGGVSAGLVQEEGRERARETIREYHRSKTVKKKERRQHVNNSNR